MKAMSRNQRKRSKSIVLNTNGISNKNRFISNLGYVRNQVRSETGKIKYDLKVDRKDQSNLVGSKLNGGKEIKGRKDLERTLSVKDPSMGEFTVVHQRRQKQLNGRMDRLKGRSLEELGKEDRSKKVDQPVTEWKEQVVRVGTGFRVRKDENNPRRRRFDVGFSDMKSYTRKEGREAVIDSSNMGRTLSGKCKDARVKVMNAVSAMEKRRRVSEYTGSGILRKSIVGKLKRKSTKAGGKE